MVAPKRQACLRMPTDDLTLVDLPANDRSFAPAAIAVQLNDKDMVYELKDPAAAAFYIRGNRWEVRMRMRCGKQPAQACKMQRPCVGKAFERAGAAYWCRSGVLVYANARAWGH